MIRSSIDIGTNSVLLLVADYINDKLDIKHEDQQIPRLGEGVDQNGFLSDEAQVRVLSVLKDYKMYLDTHYPEISLDTIVTATSAVRDAKNRKEFLNKICKITGWQVRLLTGKQEAQVTYNGALSVLSKAFDRTMNTVLDIGGGSTEIATGRGETLYEWDSLNMGSVRFTERFLKHNPPDEDQIEAARNEVHKMLSEWISPGPKIERLIGVAGTVTSMAAIQLDLAHYDSDKINGHGLSKKYLDTMIERFSSLSANEIEKMYPVFLKGRGDVIVAGLIILSEFMNYCNCSEITVSGGGIRHGMLIKQP